MVGMKRSNNTGSITRRSDGRYEARLTLPDGRRKSFYGKTWGEAERKLQRARSDLAVGRMPGSDRMTVAQLGELWLEAIEGEVADSTLENYRLRWEKNVVPVIGRIKLASVTPAHVQRVITEARAAGLATTTVHIVRAVMGIAFERAVAWQVMSHNPAKAVSVPRGEGRDLPIVEREQVAKLFAAMKGHRHETAFFLAMGLGLRAGEARGLRWADVDLERRVLHVRNSVAIKEGEITFGTLKTKSSRRDLPIPGFIAASLRRQRARQAERRLRSATPWPEIDIVLDGRGGLPLNPATLSRALDLLCDAQELPHVTFHHLRHLCATLLLMEGVAPKVAQAILGHATSRMTMDIYTHLNQELLDDAAEAMDRIFGTATA